jgi:hypothetical protein
VRHSVLNQAAACSSIGRNSVQLQSSTTDPLSGSISKLRTLLVAIYQGLHSFMFVMPWKPVKFREGIAVRLKL